jgi:hypothetical protein
MRSANALIMKETVLAQKSAEAIGFQLIRNEPLPEFVS